MAVDAGAAMAARAVATFVAGPGKLVWYAKAKAFADYVGFIAIDEWRLEGAFFTGAFKDGIAHRCVECFCAVWVCITGRIIGMGTIIDIATIKG